MYVTKFVCMFIRVRTHDEGDLGPEQVLLGAVEGGVGGHRAAQCTSE
jgi:hypothetical protein